MGKPFKQELEKIENTYQWALNLSLDTIPINHFTNGVTWIVGSGGSFSACELLALLQYSEGTIGIPITPLELQYRKNAIGSDSKFVFLSASGKNTDIIFSFTTAANSNPERILSLCFRKDSKLKLKSDNYSFANTIEFDIPSGKDGFLATNSLIGYFVILSRLHGHIPKWNPRIDYLERFEKFVGQFNRQSTIVVLYAGWSKPVAVDLESKFSEAGLGSILLSDYRSFGHGRHNWFDKQSKTGIIALVTPEEKEIATKTISLLPDDIPKLMIESKFEKSSASLDLLIQSFHLVKFFGNNVSIDPGRPGVPEYGRKLYGLQYSKLYDEKFTSRLNKKEAVAISKKIGNLNKLSLEDLMIWKSYYNSYKSNLGKTKFRGILLDYDGTVCSQDERFNGLRKNILEKLNLFLDSGILIGFATGRGKSMRKSLQDGIDPKHWDKVVIGYYNGGQIGFLSDNKTPKAEPSNGILLDLSNKLESEQLFKNKLKLELRIGQLTINISTNANEILVKKMIKDLIRNWFPFQLEVLESSHSIDIIPREISKLSTIDFFIQAFSLEKETPFLCIGDRGNWPGNDYQLLSGDFAIGVDEVSSNPYSCWNFASIGARNVDATIEYFNKITPKKSFFQIKL